MRSRPQWSRRLDDARPRPPGPQSQTTPPLRRPRRRRALIRGLGRVDGQTEALLRITHACAYAATGEKPSAARALLAAEDALLREGGPQPSYSRVSGPAAGTVASHTAHTLTDLADHPGTKVQHRAALTRWYPIRYKRVHALTYAGLGDSLAAQARADEAIARVVPSPWP